MKPPGRPPGRAPGPPPPASKAASKAASKVASKAHSPAVKHSSASPCTDLASALASRRANLQPCETRISTAPGLVPSEESASVEKQAELVAALCELAKATSLGIVVPENAKLQCASSQDGSPLGRGRFASVVPAVVTKPLEVVHVAAKRFAARADAPCLPLSALRTAKREVEVLQKVGSHPHVVQLLGIVLDPVLSCAGEDLPDAYPLQLLLQKSDTSLFEVLGCHLKWGSFGLSTANDIMLGIVRGLAAIHAAGFAHLDVKSHNILMDPMSPGPGWISRICDLGSARSLQDGRHEHDPVERGTSGWTAPEMLGDSLELHPIFQRADVFSVGIVIWEVLTGPGRENPLCGLAGDDYCKRLSAGSRPRFLDRAKDTVMAKLAARCWEFEPHLRPTLHEVVECLEANEDVH